MDREPLDLNKTALTHRCTATTALWLSGIGCKPVETEVNLDQGWVADLATFWAPSMTEAKKSRLLKDVGNLKAMKDASESFALFCRRTGGRVTIAVEVKTTRADFLRDLGRKYSSMQANRRATLKPPAHFIIVAAPRGVVAHNELWESGYLELSADGSRVNKWVGAWSLNPQLPHQIEELIAQVALRRHNVTQYASARRFWKSYRAEIKAAKAKRKKQDEQHRLRLGLSE